MLLLDTNALLHRSYHALPPLTSPKGEPVGALYGLCLTLLNVLNAFKPTHVAAAFDRPEKTFRHERYGEYKATRAKADDELVDQIIRAERVCSAFGIKKIDAKGYEADDVIGTLSRLASRKDGMRTIIVTGDADALQLVDEHTCVHMLRRGVKDSVTMESGDVRRRYGLPPSAMIDYKALRGDPSDNIPGIRGVGEKTACGLLQTYGSLENVYKHLDDLPERQRALLEKGKEDAFASRELVRIVRDIPLSVSVGDLVWNGIDRAAAVSLFQELGFASLLRRLPEAQGTLSLVSSPKRKKQRAYYVVKSDQEAKDVARMLRSSNGFVVDVETDSIHARTANVLGVSVAVTPKEAWYIPASYLPVYKTVLENRKIPKWGHNMKYDIEALRSVGIELTPAMFDSMLASYVLSPGTRSHGLNELALIVFGHEMIPIESLIGKRGKTQKTLSDIPISDVAEYACEDADYTLRLVRHFTKELKAHPSLLRVFEAIEMPLVPVLAHMELSGVRIDKQVLARVGEKAGRRLRVLEKRIHQAAGKAFNINSPSQLRGVLFDDLGLSTAGIGRTQTGYSTAAEELEKLQGKHAIISDLLEYREMAKLKSTYTDALQALIDPITQRIYTSYNQTVTATGRLSSSDPNLQNIPIRTELGAELRNAFIADDGMALVAFDYSQLELRIMAHLSEDPVMIHAFTNGEDIHAQTAALVFGVSQNEVTKDQRRVAKELNFGILYGMGASSFAASSGISVQEARLFIDQYMQTYSGVAEYMEHQKELAASKGYVETVYGRRRYLPDITSSNPRIRAAAERMAINHPAQGTESDIIKRAMIEIYTRIQKGGRIYNGSRMVLQIHDELVFEVPQKHAKAFMREVRDCMEGLEHLRVPLVVDASTGSSWGNMDG